MKYIRFVADNDNIGAQHYHYSETRLVPGPRPSTTEWRNSTAASTAFFGFSSAQRRSRRYVRRASTANRQHCQIRSIILQPHRRPPNERCLPNAHQEILHALSIGLRIIQISVPDPPQRRYGKKNRLDVPVSSLEARMLLMIAPTYLCKIPKISSRLESAPS